MPSVAAGLPLTVRSRGQRAGIASHGVEHAPEGDAAALEGGDVGDHAVEGSSFTEGAEGALVEVGAPDDVGDIDEWTVAECGFERLAGGGTQAADGAQAESDGQLGLDGSTSVH